ncbi:MAG: hypothetical protein HY072_09060 [Deltaproteobacteria bacterium]|nr:hypothetical protein [Deltaproteobacteria bacterium]
MRPIVWELLCTASAVAVETVTATDTDTDSETETVTGLITLCCQSKTSDS